MAIAALASDNFVDDETNTLSSSGAIVLAQPTVLRNPHVGKKWRDNATSTWVLLDLGTSELVDTVMLAGVSGVNPTFRVKFSSLDPTLGNLHDSGAITGVPYFDPDYGLFVYLLSAPVNARYIRVDISESGVSYIEAGRMYVGARDTFEINFQTPWTRSPVRSSVNTVGVGGQTYVDLRSGYWTTTAPFEFLTADEAFSFIEDISVAIVNTGHKDMLWIKDPASSNLSRDCTWGYLDKDPAVSQNLYIIPPRYRIEFSIRERK